MNTKDLFLPFTQAVKPFNPRSAFGETERPFQRMPDQHVKVLVDALRGAGWRKAPQLERELDVDARTIRALASSADGAVISGQKGYHLTVEADLNEVRHAVARLRSQAAEMNRRARRTEAERGI
jgi:hypothetical protein